MESQPETVEREDPRPTLDPEDPVTPLRSPSAGSTCSELTVAFFSDVLPGRSGVGTYYDDLCEHLKGRVGRVLLFSPSVAPLGGRLRSIPLPGDATQRLYFPSPRRLWRQVRDESPDVIVCATPGPYGVLGRLIARRLGAGLCVGLHTRLDDLAGLYWQRFLGPIVRPILQGWDRMMFRGAGAVLVYNEDLLERTRAEGVSRLRLVGTPAPHSFLSGASAPLRGTLSTVAFIGRLAPEKRLDQVLQAADELPHIHFRFAGDGPLRKEIEHHASRRRNVESIGWVGREQVLEILDDTDLLVLPSRYETFGTIALEALARGRPALVSPHCGISRWPELAEGLFTMDGEESLSDAIDRIGRLDPEARRSKARRGRAAARALNERTIDDWLSVVEEVWQASHDQ